MLYLPSTLSKITTRLFMDDCCPLVSRTLPVPLSLKRTLVGGRRFRPNVAALSGRRLPNLGHLEFMSLGYSNPRNSPSKRRICCRVRTSFIRVGAVVLACTFPRPVAVVDYNHLYSEMRIVCVCFL